jgi:hypothetical protein
VKDAAGLSPLYSERVNGKQNVVAPPAVAVVQEDESERCQSER